MKGHVSVKKVTRCHVIRIQVNVPVRVVGLAVDVHAEDCMVVMKTHIVMVTNVFVMMDFLRGLLIVQVCLILIQLLMIE